MSKQTPTRLLPTAAIILPSSSNVPPHKLPAPAEFSSSSIGPGGALEFCRRAREAGQVRLLGLTSHQRHLAALAAQSRLLDMLMIEMLIPCTLCGRFPAQLPHHFSLHDENSLASTLWSGIGRFVVTRLETNPNSEEALT